MDLDSQLANLREYLSGTTSALRAQQSLLRQIPAEARESQDEEQSLPFPRSETQNAHLKTIVVTHNEVNDMHGTGLLVKRLFPDDSSVMHLRSHLNYGGNDFGSSALLIPGYENPFDLFHYLSQAIKGARIESVFCVPFSSEDLEIALAVSEICQAPLGVYIMDDQNLSGGLICDEVMQKTLERASVRFAISEEMLRAYEGKFGHKFYYLPPTVEDSRLCLEPIAAKSSRGIMLGNIWAPEWFATFRHCVRDSGIEIDWYGNSNGLAEFDEKELSKEGIHYQGVLPEQELSEKLRDYAFTLLISEPLSEKSTHWLARFSLPTRLITCVASGNLPVIVLGSSDSAASAFVQKFDLGVICPYEGVALKAAVSELSGPKRQEEIRMKAAALAPSLSNLGMQDWLMKAVDEGCPPSNRFEAIRNFDKASLVPWIEPKVPSWVAHYEAESWQVLNLIKRVGLEFDFVIDVGASNGMFSRLVDKALELDHRRTRMILVEPQLEAYRRLNSWFFEEIPEAECVAVALGVESGEMTLHVTSALYDSSAFLPLIETEAEPVIVPVKRLEELGRELKLEGRGFLKVDVQGAEHLVIEGAGSFLEQIDLVMLETNLNPPDSSISDFSEIVSMMKCRGFRLFDHSGGWRNPTEGIARQLDAWFIRQDVECPVVSSEAPVAEIRP
tara:strand:+ start:1801 stop:3816 length:2016 start_codon:yes stop_codon:yes gene_type:complete